MMRDGGFKIRTDLLANKIGKTLAYGYEFCFDIPDEINILNIHQLRSLAGFISILALMQKLGKRIQPQPGCCTMPDFNFLFEKYS